MDELDAIFGDAGEDYDDEEDDMVQGFGPNVILDHTEEAKAATMVATKFLSYVKSGLVPFMKGSDLYCPMSITQNAWRHGGESSLNPAGVLSDHISMCKGNSNGFKDLNSFYQHFNSRGVECEVHAALARHLEAKHAKDITHITKDRITGQFLKDVKDVEPTMSPNDVRSLFNSMAHGDQTRKIVWPPVVIVTNIEETRFNSKTKILHEFKQYNAESAAAKYGRGRGGKTSEFKGEIILSFPATAEGYLFAYKLVMDITKGEYRPARAQMATVYHMMDFEKMQCYQKVIKDWTTKIYREVVFNPCKKLLKKAEDA